MDTVSRVVYAAIVLIGTGAAAILLTMMTSYALIRFPRVGREIQRLGHWPDGERMFWLWHFPDGAGVPLNPWLYGGLMILFGWYFRIFSGFIAVVGVFAVIFKLLRLF